MKLNFGRSKFKASSKSRVAGLSKSRRPKNSNIESESKASKGGIDLENIDIGSLTGAYVESNRTNMRMRAAEGLSKARDKAKSLFRRSKREPIRSSQIPSYYAKTGTTPAQAPTVSVPPLRQRSNIRQTPVRQSKKQGNTSQVGTTTQRGLDVLKEGVGGASSRLDPMSMMMIMQMYEDRKAERDAQAEEKRQTQQSNAAANMQQFFG